MLLAAIPASRMMNFSPQASSGNVTRTGCLLFKDNHYIMQDENTQEVVELSGGQNLNQQLGNRVEVTGTPSSVKPAASIATLVLNIAALAPQSSGGCLSAAASLNAQTEATAPTNPAQPAPESPKGGGGMSTGAKIAIVVAVAGGGAGAAIALAGKKSSTSP